MTRTNPRPTEDSYTGLFVLIVLAILLAIAWWPNDARADTKTITWTNATKNTDNSNVAATGPGSLVRTTVEYGTCVGTPKAFGVKAGEIFVAAPATTLQLPLVVVQEFCLVAFHSNTYATTFSPCITGSPGSATCPVGNSRRANTVVTQSLPPQPEPPADLAVQASSPTAYTVTFSLDRVARTGVGNVAAGTQCDTTQSVVGDWSLTGTPSALYVVPRSAVTWFGNVKPQAVFAQCG